MQKWRKLFEKLCMKLKNKFCANFVQIAQEKTVQPLIITGFEAKKYDFVHKSKQNRSQAA